MSSDQQQRASRAGRSVHGTYINMTPLDQITDTSNPAEEEYLKIAQAQERLAEIHSFIKSRGYTVFDICLYKDSKHSGVNLRVLCIQVLLCALCAHRPHCCFICIFPSRHRPQ